MNVRIRLKSRELIIGKTIFSLLVMITVSALICAINLLPYILKNTILIQLQNYNDILILAINIVFSTAILTLSISSFFAINMGIKRYFFRKAQNKNANIKDIFNYFSIKKFFPTVWFCTRLCLVKSIYFIIFQIPTMLSLSVLYYLFSTNLSLNIAVLLLSGTGILFIVGCVFFIQINSSLFLMDYYFISGEILSFTHAVASSQFAMKDKTSWLWKLRFSFVGWFLSCFLIITIPYVWGYYKQNKAVLAHIAMKK